MSAPNNKQLMEQIATIKKSFTHSKEFNKQLRTILTVEMHNPVVMNFIYEDSAEMLMTETKKRALVNKLLREHVKNIVEDILGCE